MRFRPLLPGLLFAGLIAAWIVALLLVFGSLDRNTRQQFERIAASQQLLTAMLDQEIGARGYLTTFEPVFLEPYNTARRDFDTLMERELGLARTQASRDSLMRMRVAAERWQELAVGDIRRMAVADRAVQDALREREGPIDAFRAEHEHYQDTLERERDERADALLLRAAVMIVAISLALGGIAYLLLRRDALRERRFARAQAEFATAMQSAADEREADRLLKHHLERQLDDVDVTVLRRSGSGERLEAATPPGDPGIADALADPRPRTCLAVRRGADHQQDDGEPLVACEICGAAGPSSCRPLVVGDGVIGAVHIRDPAGRVARDERVVEQSLTQAAPILSGLRTLALAQSRASTDALTGLPNRWALEDALTRMHAQATRGHRPLAFVLLDIDCFKRLNDTWGHDTGDRALAAVGEALRTHLRESDLAARSGGEEFAVLLPDTPVEGALRVAEELRRAIAEIDLGLERTTMTASFGVAVLGLHADDAHALMQAADRALYAAKRGGRDRVEVAAAAQRIARAQPLGEPEPTAS